jgi:hypothetical protein
MAHSVHVSLTGHPGNPARFHQRIDATLTHTPDAALRIVYAIHGLNIDLRVPTPHAPAPADALWRTTCHELFVGPTGESGYREFNFSPSGQSAIYDFQDTRMRAPGTSACTIPDTRCTRTEDLLRLEVTVPESALPRGEILRIALAVILEANDGKLGYWALAHPPGQPDFHHHAGFVLSLGPLGFRPAHRP